jgi:ATP-dependent Clp protease ATP-binding subunit ClpC
MNILQRFFGKTPPDAAGEKKAPTIYELARTVSDRFSEVAHPAELLRDPAFVDALANVREDDLRFYILSEKTTVASLALLALGQRGDVSAIESILESINAWDERWTRFFALEALDRLVPAPGALLGRLFVALDGSWSDGYDRFLAQFIRDFAQRRVAAGETATFGDALASASGDRLDSIGTLLAKIDSSIAKPMRDELTAFRDRRTNLDFLRGIGRVLEKDEQTIVGHAQLDASATTIVDSLAAERRRSVIVVGEEGVGKSTIIRAAARRLRDDGWTIFEATAAELNAGQMYIGQLEGRIQKILRNMRGSRRVAWIIPNIHELQNVGATHINPMGALDMLLPEIESGTIVVVGETTPRAYQKLLEQNPRASASFLGVRIAAMGDADTLALAKKWVSVRANERIADDVLAEAWKLSSQYLAAQAAPGNILRLLELTIERVEDGAVGIDDVLATLTRTTGLPLDVLDERTPLDLSALRVHFEKRVLGQPEAIDALVERIAMIKAGVTDPTRPLGVFLFAGPTGTGKTEIAKSLTEFLFGSAERMLRLDMSELQTVESLGRLIGDDDRSTRSLVDDIRKQPFAVVLLDEMEKAHPRVLDLFLQVFDDGRLTDRRGNTADFRHAIVILTSNIGAAIRSIGLRNSEGSNIETALGRELRKEFLNRVDRIVVFRPLSRDTMRGILRKELADAFHRRGLRNRDWAVEWDDSAIELLLRAGFTEDLGARPLKRAVERHFLTPLAERIVCGLIPDGDHFLFVRAEGNRLEIDFVSLENDSSTAANADLSVPSTAALETLVLQARGTADEVVHLRARYETLIASVRSDEWISRKTIALSMTSLPEFWSSPERFEILGEVEMRDRIEGALDSARSLLDRLRGGATAAMVRRVAQQLWLVGLAVEDLRARRAAEALLLIEPRGDESKEWAARVATMYRNWALRRGMSIETVEESGGRVTLSISGFAAHTLLAPEAGLHVLEMPGARGGFERRNARVRVALTMDELQNSTLEPVIVRRYREHPSALVRDSVRNWRTGRVDVVLDGNFDVMTSQ